MVFRPDGPYRLGLGLGALFLVLLACLALFGRRASSYEAVGPRRRLPFAVLAGPAFLVTLVIGGVVMAILLVPLFYAARRWGSDLMAAVAGVSFMVAGIIVALNPGTVPGYHLGAFSASVQFLSVVAISAVMCAVVIDDRSDESGVSYGKLRDPGVSPIDRGRVGAGPQDPVRRHGSSAVVLDTHGRRYPSLEHRAGVNRHRTAYFDRMPSFCWSVRTAVIGRFSVLLDGIHMNADRATYLEVLLVTPSISEGLLTVGQRFMERRAWHRARVGGRARRFQSCGVGPR